MSLSGNETLVSHPRGRRTRPGFSCCFSLGCHIFLLCFFSLCSSSIALLRHHVFRIQIGYPFQCPDTRHEAVFASAHVNELWRSMKAPTNREFGNREGPICLIVADDRILLSPLIYEISIRYPLRLHKFKLLFQMRSDQKENAASLGAVLFQLTFRQRLTIVRTATQELVKIYGHNLVPQCIAWIYASDVRAERTLESLHVLFIVEGVIAVQIRTQTWIITRWSQYQWRATAPSADHFRRDQFLFFGR